ALEFGACDLVRHSRMLEAVAEQVQFLAAEFPFQHVEEVHKRVLGQDALAGSGERHRAFVLLEFEVAYRGTYLSYRSPLLVRLDRPCISHSIAPRSDQI